METMRMFMIRNGFAYKNQKTHYQFSRERDDIVLMCDNYLEWINYYWRSVHDIYYQDETWVFKNMSPKNHDSFYLTQKKIQKTQKFRLVQMIVLLFHILEQTNMDFWTIVYFCSTEERDLIQTIMQKWIKMYL